MVDGLPTWGLRTLVDVDRLGVLGALGVPSRPAAGDAYPIITAAAALDLLRAMPRAEPAIACAVGSSCPGTAPQVVTGARLGLTMAYDDGSPVLVPAWLFSLEGTDDPVAVVAVERRYLADPAPPDGSGSSGAGSGSSTGSSGSAVPRAEASTGPTPPPPSLPRPVSCRCRR